MEGRVVGSGCVAVGSGCVAVAHGGALGGARAPVLQRVLTKLGRRAHAPLGRRRARAAARALVDGDGRRRRQVAVGEVDHLGAVEAGREEREHVGRRARAREEVLWVLPELGAPADGARREPCEQHARPGISAWTRAAGSDAPHELGVVRPGRLERLTAQPLAAPPRLGALRAQQPVHLVKGSDLLRPKGLPREGAGRRVGRGAARHDADDDGTRVGEERREMSPVGGVGIGVRARSALAEVDDWQATGLLEQRGKIRASDDAHDLGRTDDDIKLP